MSKEVVGFIAGVVALVALGSCSVVTQQMSETVIPSVTFIADGDRIVKSDSSYYVVYADGETFRNEDSLWYGKFNSGDLQPKFQKGVTCTNVKVIGHRVDWLSWNRNITSFDQCS